MPEPVPPELFAKGRDAWNAWRQQNISAPFEFYKKHRFDGDDLTKWNFRDIIFTEVHFIRCDMTGCECSGAVFTQCIGREAILGNLDNAQLAGTYFTNAKFERGALSLKNVRGHKGGFRECNVPILTSEGAQFAGTTFVDCEFHSIERGSSLAGAIFRRCKFTDSKFAKVDLRGAKFEHGTVLDKCDLTAAEVGQGTDISAATLKDCKIDRHTADMLGQAGITANQLRELTIDDPFARMRVAFSGLMRNVHIIALILFLLPYVTFVVESYVKSRMFAGHVELYKKLFEFAVTGGKFTVVNPWHVGILVFSIVYNVLRGILVYKTNTLEMEYASTNRVPRFS